NSVMYPPHDARRQQTRAAGCPEFRSMDSVLIRPNGAPAGTDIVFHGLPPYKALGGGGILSSREASADKPPSYDASASAEGSADRRSLGEGGQSDRSHSVVW